MIQIILGIFILMLFGCSQQESPMETITVPSLNKNVLFGHQSVGENILSGIRDVSPESIEKIHDVSIGNNREPISKIIDFERAIHASKDIDVAMMKFCFVDIPNHLTSIQIIEYYSATIYRLQKQYPNIKFVHVTVPLTGHDSNLKNQVKTLIKKILGRPTYNHANKARNEFNQMLIRVYPYKTVFDLAAIESDNGRYQENGAPALNPDYTYDGGHLNEKGRQAVAKELLEYLNTL